MSLNQTSTPSRRALLGGSFALLAAGSTAAGASQDAELIRMGHLWDAAFTLATVGDGEGKSDEEFDAGVERYCEIEFAIHDIPAQTIEGLAVKARIALDYAIPKDPEDPRLDDVIVCLIDDVLRLAKERQS